jgi:hypothetical protein
MSRHVIMNVFKARLFSVALQVLDEGVRGERRAGPSGTVVPGPVKRLEGRDVVGQAKFVESLFHLAA